MAGPYDDVIREAQVQAEELAAELGGVEDPREPFYAALGFSVRPGDKVTDSVTGLTGEVVHGTVVNVSPADTGDAVSTDSVHPAA